MKAMQKIFCKAAVLLAFLMLCTAWSVGAVAPSAYAAESSGSFQLVAVGSKGAFIGPEEVSYTSGQTVAQALQASSHKVNIDPATGFLNSIDDHADGFNLFMQDSGYDLSRPASEVTLLYIREVDGESELSFDESMASLLLDLAKYEASTDGMKNYTPAKKAATSAWKDIYFINTSKGNPASQYGKPLSTAIADWKKLQAGTRVTVVFAANQGDSAVFGATVSVKDAWGNEQKVTSGSASLLVGSEYTYEISRNNNAVTGKVTPTSSTKTVTASLPQGDWFAKFTFFHAKSQLDSAYAVNGSQVYVPDYVMDDEGLGFYVNIVDAVSCPSDAKLTAVYTGTDGSAYEPAIPWESTSTKLNKVLGRGTVGNDVTFKASVAASDGTTQVQSRTFHLMRVGTLTGLSLVDADGVQQVQGFANNVKSYEIKTLSDTLTCSATAGEAFAVSIDGKAVEAGAAVSLDASAAGTEHQVTVLFEDRENTYTVKLVKTAGVPVTLKFKAGVNVSLLNAAESSLVAASTTSTSATYNVVAGEQYTYVATADVVSHLRRTFTAESGQSFDVTTPYSKNWLDNIELYTGTGSGALVYDHLDNWKFEPSTHSFSWIIDDVDTSTALAMKLTEEGVADGVSGKISWNRQSSGSPNSTSPSNTVLTKGSKVNLGQFHRKGTIGNTAKIVLTASQPTAAGETIYQDYEASFVVKATLGDLTVDAGGNRMTIKAPGSDEDGFDREYSTYRVNVPEGTTAIDLGLKLPESKGGEDDLVYGAYVMDVNGESIAFAKDSIVRAIELKDEGDTEVKVVVAGTTDPNTIATTYTVTVKRATNVPVKIITTPENACVTVIQTDNSKRIWPDENGTYKLMDSFTYRYTVASPDYVGTKGSFTAESGMKDLTIKLDEAPPSPGLDKATEASWPYFRADENNNGVVDYATPIDSEDATLYWATKLGDGYSSGATGCPILVDGYLYTYANTHIYKVDVVSGEVVATGDMVASSSFAINSPTYADGMIFVGLSKGRVQAFNAKTLKSMWLYTDELGGQPNCPIAYKDGLVYTGFWNAETRQANFVCLSTTDEDPSDTEEAKIPLWTHTDNGFYWAGAYVGDGFVLVGTDDGDTGYLTEGGKVLSLDARTGRIIDYVDGLRGDVRSNVCRDEATGRYYFTSKGGYLFGMDVDENGRINHDTFKKLYLYNYADSPNQPPMSTCTPCIRNGRAYIGVSGTAQFGAYSGHNITVVDLRSMRIAYSVRTQGYPQTSGLVTTAYDKGDGTVYVYFFDNYTPGVLRILEDKPGQTEPKVTIPEAGYDCAPILFTPDGAQAQYAICSPVADSTGTIYFKNDSAYMMALGPAITELRVAKKPTKMVYQAGERFDASGMKVEAVYSNGTVRDVTKYVTVDTKTPLTTADNDMEIVFKHVMYHDVDGQPGKKVTRPSTSINITVKPKPTPAPTPQPTPVALNASKVKLSATTYSYNGKAQKPKVTISGLTAGTDYTVSYASGRTKVGKYKVTVTGKGKYKGTVTKTFTIKPAVAAAPKITMGKKKLTVKKWAVTGASSYQVQVKIKGGKWVTKKKLTAPKKLTIKKLKKGKKYQVRIVSVSSVGNVAGKATALKKVK